jgi:hypothetical protein
MYRSTCFIQIGARQVHGQWQAARWAGSAAATAAAEFSDDEMARSLRGAIDQVLGAILPKRLFTSPFVRVSLAGPHVMAAILPFAKLPASAADRRLVITQRFCREHRLEPGSIAVTGYALNSSKTASAKILCFAVEQRLLDTINSALAAKGLYPDAVAPGYLLRLAEANGRGLEAPGIAMFEESDCYTILVWDEHGAIAHVATVGKGGGDDSGARQRVAARIGRYAQIIAPEGNPPSVYIGGDKAIAAELASRANGLKVLRWPEPLDDSAGTRP